MRCSVYADESSTKSGQYMFIGGIWVDQEREQDIRSHLSMIKACSGPCHEMKWNNVSRRYASCYLQLLDAFFEQSDLDFHCIVIDKHIVDYRRYHDRDKELAFYKFYNLILRHRMRAEVGYYVYPHRRTDQKKTRLDDLHLEINKWWQDKEGVSPVLSIEPRRSQDEIFLQLADILLGAFAYEWNGYSGGEVKLTLVSHIRERLGWETLRYTTSPKHPKVTVWKWRPAVASEAKEERPNS